MKAMVKPDCDDSLQRKSPQRTVLRGVLGLLQFIGFIATLACLFLTGPSVWTFLVGLGAATVTKASLVLMDRQPDFGDDTEAISELADRVTNGHNRCG